MIKFVCDVEGCEESFVAPGNPNMLGGAPVPPGWEQVTETMEADPQEQRVLSRRMPASMAKRAALMMGFKTRLRCAKHPKTIWKAGSGDEDGLGDDLG